MQFQKMDAALDVEVLDELVLQTGGNSVPRLLAQHVLQAHEHTLEKGRVLVPSCHFLRPTARI